MERTHDVRDYDVRDTAGPPPASDPRIPVLVPERSTP